MGEDLFAVSVFFRLGLADDARRRRGRFLDDSAAHVFYS